MKARVMMIALAAGLTTWGSSASAVCPYTRSAPDNARFDYNRDAGDCVLDLRVEGAPESRAPVHYTVTCPGRMTKADAERVGRGLAGGWLKVRPGPPTPGDPRDPAVVLSKRSLHEADGFRENNVKPTFVGIPYLAHHTNCTTGIKPRPIVSTDFKVTVKMQVVGPAEIAASCKEVNQSGSIAWHQRMDREYRCGVHFLANEQGVAAEAATYLLRRDYKDEAKRKNLKVCALRETSIQCAPCSTTNKLVVRVLSVAKGDSCPAGTIGSID